MISTPSQPMKVDLDLVKKYNRPGPRYTSYPPATQFTDDVSPSDLLQCIQRNNENNRDLSLYFHLPFCESLCWFCGCTTVITSKTDQSSRYISYLEKELDWMRKRLDPQRQVTQLHFGGGTPTFLPPDQIRTLGEVIHSRFKFAEDIEAGVEVDPRRLTRDHVKAFHQMGCRRASMGVQDNQPEVQQAIHRIQPLDLTRQAVDWIREEGYTSINIDLIFGLPHQTVKAFEQTLEEILELAPDRFAVFSYAHVPWIKPAQKIFKDEALPTPETKLELLKLTTEKLTGAGYVYIGMDHFARPDDELVKAQLNKTLQRNFQGYSTRGNADIYSFGMSSISQIPEAYWQNRKELDRYYTALDADQWPVARGYILTPEDQLRRQTIMRLMCDLGLDYQEMDRLLSIRFTEHFARELASLEDLIADGLVRVTQQGITVTELGRLLIRNIAMHFDAYLPGQQREGRYSKTI